MATRTSRRGLTNGSPAALYKNRIVGHGEEVPTQLLANPKNWRIHPRLQQRALRDVLAAVGWVGEVLVNRTTGHVVDGHLRVELAISDKEPTVPVTYVELTPEEEDLVLASLDPIASLAGRDDEKFRELIAEASLSFADLEETLQSFVGDFKSWEDRQAEWDGMPEYEQDDLTGFHDIRIRFPQEEDMEAFAELIGQNITSKTRTVWYPEQPILATIDKRYVDEDEAPE